MSDSRVEASIQLESYKIDHADFNVVPNMAVLRQKTHSDCVAAFDLAFRDAHRFFNEQGHYIYITGLKAGIKIDSTLLQKTIAEGEFCITGSFLQQGELDKETEERLIKYQAPAILMPYLRAAMSFIVTSAGFSTIIFPLVNINAAAHSGDIKIVDVKPDK